MMAMIAGWEITNKMSGWWLRMKCSKDGVHEPKN